MTLELVVFHLILKCAFVERWVFFCCFEIQVTYQVKAKDQITVEVTRKNR